MSTRRPGSANRDPGKNALSTRRSASRPPASAPLPDPGPRTQDPDGEGRGILYVVATPIGTLGDLSTRAREVLAGVRLILAEDTRRVRKLLNHFAITTPAQALEEHNEARLVPALLARLARGEPLALVSDAGTPLLADPGYRLVRACRERGITVLAVPGPSAVTAALSVAGLPPTPCTFAGFLPPAAGQRARALARLAELGHTVVLFLSPHRLAAELAACQDAFGREREAALLAELSKLHERCLWGQLATIGDAVAAEPPRGEYTLVVGPAGAVAASPPPGVAEAHAALAEALAGGLELADARREAARRLGVPRRVLYELLTRRDG